MTTDQISGKAGIDVQYMYSMHSLKDHIPCMMVRVADPAALDALPNQ